AAGATVEDDAHGGPVALAERGDPEQGTELAGHGGKDTMRGWNSLRSICWLGWGVANQRIPWAGTMLRKRSFGMRVGTHGDFFEGASLKAPAPHPCPLPLASR